MAIIETYRGSVDTWECDMNNHLNVQFYVAHAADGLVALGHSLGLTADYIHRHNIGLVAREHHIRFHQEQRPGSPIVMQGGVLEVSANGDGLKVYQEMRNIASKTVAATFLTRCELVDRTTRQPQALPDFVALSIEALRTDLPKHGAPRGIEVIAPRPPPTLAEADQLGMVYGYQGLIGVRDCDRYGFMKTSGYMACISTAVPVLISEIRGMKSRDKRIGGAALEYRLVYRRAPRLGDRLILRSGLRSLGSKTFGWGHWLFDGNSGECVAGAESVAVMLDLIARKAIAIPEEMHSALQPQVLREFGI
jgi:acyl-CoA thioester hydrolase